MSQKKKIKKRQRFSIFLIVVGISAFGGLLFFMTEGFGVVDFTIFEERDPIVNDGDILPQGVVRTQLPCTPEEEITPDQEIGVDVWPCDAENQGSPEFEEPVDITPAETSQANFDRFLEQVGFSSIDQFGVGTLATLTDIQGNQTTASSILAIPLLSFETPEGFFPETLEVQFFGVIKDQQAVSLNLEGSFDVLIDDKIIDSKKLFVSGTILDVNTIPLLVVDQIPATFEERQPVFKFLFEESDFDPTPSGALASLGFPTEEELLASITSLETNIASPLVSEDVKPNMRLQLQQARLALAELRGEEVSLHTIRVIIRDLTGTYQAQGVSNSISWVGEFIAYELMITFDQERVVIIDENNQLVSVFKSDTRLLVCGSEATQYKSGISYNRKRTDCIQPIPPTGILADVRVYENIGNNVTGRIIGEVLRTDEIACQEISGLSRSTDYIFEVGGDFTPVTTPLPQFDYNVDFSTGGGVTKPKAIGSFAEGNFRGYTCTEPTPFFEIHTSNFGYSFKGSPP